jgi:hypothetical protein
VLAPGSYVVGWTSITDNDQTATGAITPPIFNNGNNLITINTTTIQYNEQTPNFFEQDKYPGGGSATQSLYGGTFTYTANTPEPGVVSLFGGMVVMGSSVLIRRRRLQKKKA